MSENVSFSGGVQQKQLSGIISVHARVCAIESAIGPVVPRVVVAYSQETKKWVDFRVLTVLPLSYSAAAYFTWPGSIFGPTCVVLRNLTPHEV